MTLFGTVIQYVVAACWIGAVVAVFGSFFLWVGKHVVEAWKP